MKLRRIDRALLALALVSICAGCSAIPPDEPLMKPEMKPDMKPESKPSALHPAEMVGFAVTTDAARARAFYEGKLGFRVLSDDRLALVLDADGRMLRIQKMKEHEPRPYTVLGWNVSDLPAAIARLAAAGVSCERFPGLPLDERGIMDFPDGTRLAWFKDPDGNVLSVAQMPR